MLKYIIKRFIPNSENTSDADVRIRYGILAGALGTICNLLLFAAKLIAGTAINSIAVISDAFNNLSDLGSSLISVIGSRLSGKSADDGHPYGHGRAEYISALIIAILIILFGSELFKSSIESILSPKPVALAPVSLVILLLSVPVKLWMWYYNRYMGKKINSSILFAAAKDSLNDCVATSAVIASACVSPFISFPIDGIAGLCVSAMIFKGGFDIAKDTIDSLMGCAPSEELIEEIKQRVLAGSNIMGMHDLMVHDYGPERKIASVHAEVPDNLSLVEVHSTIDKIEHEIYSELGVDIVIHMDPVHTNDTKV